MAYRSSSTNTGTSATPATAVPASVVAGDIVLLMAAGDDASWAFDPADWPAGFTELQEGSSTLDGQKAAIGWKRLTGSDAGSYTFGSVGSSQEWVCQAVAFSDRHATDPPVATLNSSSAANTNPVTVTGTGVTAVSGDDLLWVVATDVHNSAAIYNGTAVPGGMSEQQDTEHASGWAAMACATQDAVAGGATGDKAGTVTLTGNDSGWICFLVRVPSAVTADNTMKGCSAGMFDPDLVPGGMF